MADFDEANEQTFAALEREGRGAELMQLAPFFGVLWPAARVLGEYLASLGPAAFAGKTVLEIGCGLALPSLVAARLGARVTACDFHPDVPAFLRQNLARNSLESVRYAALDWRDERAGEALGRFDYVVASDVLYEREHADLTAACFARHLAASGTGLLADPGRAFGDGLARETVVAESAGVKVYRFRGR